MSVDYDLTSAKLLARQMFRHACAIYLAQKAWRLKSIGQYERALWSACLNFFRGDIDAFGFIDAFMGNIENQLGRAWNEGARKVDVEPEEMTPADIDILAGIVDSENEHILNIAQAIEDAINSDMSLDDFRSRFRARVDLWVNRYNEVVNYAEIYFGGKKKLIWVLGETEEHCATCSRLNGIVAYAEEWAASGIQPQNPPNDVLECGGWKCDCKLEPTDRRRSPDALGTLLDIAAAAGIEK